MTGDPADLVQAIVEWSGGRPWWAQQALGMLARGDTIGDKEVEALADMAERQAGGKRVRAEPLKATDLLGRVEGSEPVSVLGISEPKSVNALTWSDGLQFAQEGVTIVYGQNGSGKSGYARILKKVTRARHDTDVLTNVFETPADQSALLSVACGDTEANLHWPLERPDYLSRVSFYDRDCSMQYISTDTEVAYRPGSLTLLDRLVGVAGRVREVLDRRRSHLSSELTELPELPLGSRAAAFATSLSADTKSFEIDLASEVPTDADRRLAALRQRIANLEAEDLDQQRNDLTQLINAVEEVRNHIERTRKVMSESAIEAVEEARRYAAVAREAADAANAARFDAEPLEGVGSQAWRILWDAARRYSEEAAYPGAKFPVLGDGADPARCVLCHQELADQAVARLQVFEESVAQDVEKTARESQQAFERLVAAVQRHEILGTGVELALQRIGSVSAHANAELRAELDLLDVHRSQVVEALDSGTEAPQIIPLGDLSQAALLLDETETQLADLAVDDREAQLVDLREEEGDLVGRKILAEHREAIETRITEAKRLRTLDTAFSRASSRGITRKAAELMRTHVSDVLKHHFSQEALSLDLERVRLADAGGRQGNLKHRAQLVGAVQRAPLVSVLSEGQQTALGLAGFLTEVQSDTSSSAVVFDDPVTSLDHVVQERVARRMVNLAQDRQVIVFTHDIGFVVDLKRAANASSLPVTERWVTRLNAAVGQVSDGGPWQGRIVSQRINELTQRLSEVRKIYADDDPAARQEAARSWYQDLRVVWERALEEVVIGPVSIRGKLELRPSNLKVLAQFTEIDNQEFQAAFTRCGDRGSHDASPELNRPLPRIEEMEEDLELVRTWHRRVRKYENQ